MNKQNVNKKKQADIGSSSAASADMIHTDIAKLDQTKGEERIPSNISQGLLRSGLSGRLLILMLVFALCAQALVFVASMTAFRRSWLNDRLAAAQIAALVLEAVPEDLVPPAIEEKLLGGVGAIAVALSTGSARHLLSRDHIPSTPLHTIDLRETNWGAQIYDTFRDLLFNSDKTIRILGDGKGEILFVELIMASAPLHSAMITFAIHIGLLSLFVWGAAAASLYLALMRIIVKPVRRLAEHITAFEKEPGNPERFIVPSGSKDEIGQAEHALERMERTLATELRQQQRLATLGLAVAKVSHELRNMLTTAQLISDRLAQVTDPVVERFSPRLIATLDRAIAYCESALAYGRANEPAPQRRHVLLRPIVEELRDNLGLTEHSNIQFIIDIPDKLVIYTDEEYLARILLNLGRNAIQALEQDTTRQLDKDHNQFNQSSSYQPQESNRFIMVKARLIADSAPPLNGPGMIEIRFVDNGPGVTPKAQERLFEPFYGTTRSGGSGLGLAITAELVRAQGGQITFAPQASGSCFIIQLPHISG